MKRTFVKSSPDDVVEVPSESSQRMDSLTEKEKERLYGRGYQLLKRSGYTGELSHAPIKVLVRNPREGLRDYDHVGRKVLGDSAVKKVKPNEDWLKLMISDVELLKFHIREEVRNHDGCCEITHMFEKLKRNLRLKNRLLFGKALGLVEVEGVKISAEGTHLILTTPPPSIGSFSCACEKVFQSERLWSIHVFQHLEDTHHEEYIETLLRSSESSPHSLFCLICVEDGYSDLLRLLLHCRQVGDTQHEMFGRLLISTYLSTMKKGGGSFDILLTGALETGDPDFPWRSQCGGATDPFENIPFPKDPPTPIVLDVESDIDEPVEIIDVDQPMIGEVNLED